MTVRAQDDLFRHVNGEWLANGVIPEDRSMDGAFYQLRDGAEADSRAIVEEAAAHAATARSRGRPAQLIGDLYRSFMDTDTVETPRPRPGHRAARRDRQVTDAASLFGCSARLRRDGIGGPFAVDVDSDSGRPRPLRARTSTRAASACPTSRTTATSSTGRSAQAYTEFLPQMLALAGLPRPGRQGRPDLRAGEPAGRRALGPGAVPGQLADLQPDGPGRAGRAAAGRLGRLAHADCGARTSAARAGRVRQPDFLDARSPAC